MTVSMTDLPRLAAPTRVQAAVALPALFAADAIMRLLPKRAALAAVAVLHRFVCRPADAGLAERLVTAVRDARRYYPRRAACLELSLAAVLLAAAGGRRLGWVIGAQVDPVAVHACVAAGGRIVGELDETDRAFYRVITV